MKTAFEHEGKIEGFTDKRWLAELNISRIYVPISRITTKKKERLHSQDTKRGKKLVFQMKQNNEKYKNKEHMWQIEYKYQDSKQIQVLGS